MTLMDELSGQVGVSQACRTLALPRSWYYRQQADKLENNVLLQAPPRLAPKHALSDVEKAAVRTTLNSERFMEQSPREVYATLLDEGTYLCHWRTMYRILAEHDEVRERRNQRRHPVYKKPELLATGPNQVWSWDGRPFGRLVNVSGDTAHYQGCASSPWRFKKPSNLGLVSIQGTRASRAKEANLQYANVQEWMDRG